ncbi:MAG TPA: heavy metal-associated domain-containing protein [Planctomycetaceae bacterium]|nr:heavy metal-associated domain-containing protein [Planctomycetaceae bacterium]
MTSLLAIAMVGLPVATTVAADDPPATISEAKPELLKSTFLLSGLHCPPCTTTVERSLKGIKGVRSVKVDWTTKNARVEFDEKEVTAQQLAAQIGSTPHMMGAGMRYAGWLALKTPGIDTAGASDKAKTALMAVKGVTAVTVYPQQKALGVAFAPQGKATTDELLTALKDAGVEATLFP